MDTNQLERDRAAAALTNGASEGQKSKFAFEALRIIHARPPSAMPEDISKAVATKAIAELNQAAARGDLTDLQKEQIASIVLRLQHHSGLGSVSIGTPGARR